MNRIAIAVHGGAGDVSDFILEHKAGYAAGLQVARDAGYEVLKGGGSAVDAVLAAVRSLEDNPLFNAGRGGAWDAHGHVTHDAAVMDGSTRKAGGVALIHLVKNPVLLAHAVMTQTNHVLLAGEPAVDFARKMKLQLEAEAYFKTKHREAEFLKSRKESEEEQLKKRNHGTVGAVAVDAQGHIAAATSTGGTDGRLPGRVGDSCIIGAGCFADNHTCAVSGTGDGEFLMTGVVAHSIALLMELKGMSVQEACDYVIHERNKGTEGDLGVIAVSPDGEIGMAYNSERLHRAWIDGAGGKGCEVY